MKLLHPFLETFYWELKKLSILFQFIKKKKFSKIINYCVSLGHTLAKSNFVYQKNRIEL